MLGFLCAPDPGINAWASGPVFISSPFAAYDLPSFFREIPLVEPDRAFRRLVASSDPSRRRDGGATETDGVSPRLGEGRTPPQRHPQAQGRRGAVPRHRRLPRERG